ncbi:MAG: hypothetical protein EZS28_031451 [Streblomastix strix]|uniref:Elongator complex protein 2 n=1 Tax=Streblomastix strix TaxID=222440 RepID=A0A5J4USH7_9EUKA|nr:MAG: hypothetical protein EZS28_031451 [Streblomastix strix]
MTYSNVVNIALEDIRVGCNASVGGLSLGANKMLLFGANNNVGIADISRCTVLALLSGHTNVITSVKWIPKEKLLETEFISCSADATMRYWIQNERNTSGWDCLQVLYGHSSTVLGCSLVALSDGKNLLASLSSDSTVRIWRSDIIDRQWETIQIFNFSPQIICSVSLFAYSNSENGILLALGSVDFHINIYHSAYIKSQRLGQRFKFCIY